MPKIYFDNKWSPVSSDQTDDVLYTVERTDDGHVYFRIGEYGINTHRFGGSYPRTMIAFEMIEELLEPLSEFPHFQEPWKEFLKTFDSADAVDYLSSEHNDNEVYTEYNVEIFAKLHVACYPVLRQIFKLENYLYDGFYGVSNESCVYEPHHSAITYRELVEKVFGTFQNDVARELRNVSVGQSDVIAKFKELIHPTQLVEIMKNSKNQVVLPYWTNQNWAALANVPNSVRVRLLKEVLGLSGELVEVDFQEIDDTLEMLEIVGKSKKFRGSKTWKDVHDRALKLTPTLTGHRIVEVHEDVERLATSRISKTSNSSENVEIVDSGSSVSSNDSSSDTSIELSRSSSSVSSNIENFSFSPLRVIHDFINLGEELDICIGKAGYYAKGLRGESYCLKIKDSNDVSIGALEVSYSNFIRAWDVKQLRGIKNTRLEDHEELKSHILLTLNQS